LKRFYVLNFSKALIKAVDVEFHKITDKAANPNSTRMSLRKTATAAFALHMFGNVSTWNLNCKSSNAKRR